MTIDDDRSISGFIAWLIGMRSVVRTLRLLDELGHVSASVWSEYGLILCMLYNTKSSVCTEPMRCVRHALSQRPPAGQAATRSVCGRLAHTWPWQHARVTPWPPRAHHCAGWSAVCHQWHTTPTKAQTHTTLLRAADFWHAHARAHEKRCV